MYGPSRSPITLPRGAPWLALLAAAACTDRPTAPLPGGAPARRVVAAAGVILPVDLGTLPGASESEATYVTDDGAVYGYSGGRAFRWTAAGGMTEVSSIPAPPQTPLPSIGSVPSPYARVEVRGANTKGEATGLLCVTADCGGRYGFQAHAFRFSRGAGAVALDRRFVRDVEPPEADRMSHGQSINRWGHGAGSYAMSEGPPDDSENSSVFFWTPVDSFALVGGYPTYDETLQLNDVDQLIGMYGLYRQCSFVWRPDLGLRELARFRDRACDEEGPVGPLAQQTRGTWVVGSLSTSEVLESDVVVPGPLHAALWRVPAVNRAAYPRVNAAPIAFTSTISLRATGGRYFQFYRATQGPKAGPYVEHVDWGDGSSSRRTRAALGNTVSQSHVYARAGTYWIRVYVQDAQKRWGVAEHQVTVTP